MKRMKKGLFSRYIIAFMLVIALSFAVLAVLIASLVRSYATDNKQETLLNCGASVCNYFQNEYKETGIKDFNNFVYAEFGTLENAICLLANNYEDLYIMVADEAGNILLTSDEIQQNYTGQKLPASALANAGKDINETIMTDFDGIYESRYLSVVATISADDGTVVGYLVVSSSSAVISGLLRNMLRTIIAFSLWIFLAALVALYFITERITSPLKEMSQAAKSYADGHFDVRVPVKGNNEISDLAVAFNHMANTLATAENQRSAFLANVAHDLRTPMTTIAGFIDGILAGAIPPDKQQYYLELIASEVRRLSRLVSSLLDITRIQAGERKFTPTSFDICEMARQILISFEKQIDEKKLNVEFDSAEDSVMVNADRDAIHQVLYNICHNAVKFSRPGGLYRVSIKVQNKKALVSIHNEGDGIPAADLPYVFDRFYKSDKSRGLDKTGVGLGLYIVKTIMTAHHEDIWADSVEGEYCEFSFTLTLADEK